MNWDYRVMYFEKVPPDESYHAIHEVHYDPAGNPVSYTENAVPLLWDSGFIGGLDVLAKMQHAFSKPALRPDYFKTDRTKSLKDSV